MFYVAVNFIIGNRIAQRIIAPLSWFHYIKVIMAFLLYILQFPCKENLDIKPDWLDVWLAIFANDDMVWGDKSERKCPHQASSLIRNLHSFRVLQSWLTAAKNHLPPPNTTFYFANLLCKNGWCKVAIFHDFRVKLLPSLNFISINDHELVQQGR